MLPAAAGPAHCHPLTAALALVITFRNVLEREARGFQLIAWIAIVITIFSSGAGLAFLGDRSRRFAAQNHFLSSITATMQVEQGLAESLRLFLEELAQSFQTEQAFLLFRDIDSSASSFGALKAAKVSASRRRAMRSRVPTVFSG